MLGGSTPSLLVGLAGIGHFYLRSACPSVPSVLLIRPGEWGRQIGRSSTASDSGSRRRPPSGEAL
jgi:lantibiotic biosynthesis protein